MRSKRVLVIAIIAAVLLTFFLTTATFGCIPADDGTCAVTTLAVQAPGPVAQVNVNAIKSLGVKQKTLKKTLVAFVKSARKAPAVPPAAPPVAPPKVENEEPTKSVVPQGTWVYISAHATVWFHVGDALRRLSVSVDAGHQSGLEMSVYSPELQDVRNSDPTGRGAPVKGHDLWWSGAARGKGAWYVKLKNANDFSIPYNLITATVTDSGVEYRPDVTYEFGTGDSSKTVKVATGKPAAPPAAQPAASHAPMPPKPGSADPFNAPAPSGTWFYIEPHTSVWYSVSDRGRRLNVWMDADRNSGLVMAVYGADIQDVWSRRPTGQGLPGEGHAYFWTGRSRFKGMWKIRITNPTDVSVPYNLAAQNISDKNGDLCRDCHGGSIDEEEFGRCEHEGSFCDDLRDQFKN